MPKKQKAIVCFKGPYRFLSNFYYFSNTTVEHQFQAAKTTDPEWKQRILNAPTPGMAKRLGRKCPCRPNWDKARDLVMLRFVRAKFHRPALAVMLLQTGNARLIEGNDWHDNYWGICQCDDCHDKPGLNVLGNILMNVREELRADHA
jgi:ribA/ribD-fused uncharacterized protein